MTGSTTRGCEQIEWECDQIVALVGRVIADGDDAPQEQRFTDWLARDARNRSDGTGEQMGAERVEALRERMRRRARLERVRVHRVNHEPERRPVTGNITAADLLGEGAIPGTAPLIELAVAAGVGRALWDTECDTLVAIPEEVPMGNHLALRVSGDSMTPLLHTGDVILVRLDGGVKRDTVIVARLPEDGGYVVKRVGAVSRRAIELQSLNESYPPVKIPNDPALVVGTVILRWCEHGESGTDPHPL